MKKSYVIFLHRDLKKLQKSFYTPHSNVRMGSRMVCEFLPIEHKKMLIAIATIDDLMRAGYSRAGAYKAKERFIISDEKCEKLVEILGDRARDILIDALKQFAIEIGCYVSCQNSFYQK
jgi:hypothetical protein